MTAAVLELAKPGVYDAIPEDSYHADPVPGGSLSSTGARKLIQTCPAEFWHWKNNRQPPKKELDFGTAVHTLVLGEGPDVVEIDADAYTTKAARESRDAVRAEGKIPLLRAEYAKAHEMAKAVHRNKLAHALFGSHTGRLVEQTMVWVDPETGVTCRGRVDSMGRPSRYRRTLIADYKTARSVAPDAVAKAIHDYGLHQQAAWYLEGARQLGWAEASAGFVFVFQQKEPPYLVTPVELDNEALLWGQRLNRTALRVYRQCWESGRWPGYSDGLTTVSLPAWAVRRYEWMTGQGLIHDDTTNSDTTNW